MSDSAELNLDELPEWARGALSAAFERRDSKSTPLTHLNAAAWPLLVEAAVVGSFLPRDLAPHALSGEERAEAEKAVLAFAETAHGPRGVRWSLTQAARAEVLGAALNTKALKEALTHAGGSADFADPVSSALRECLTSGVAASEPSDLKSLEAARVAVAALSGVPGLKLPALDELDRRIEFRRLLAKFERMIGVSRDGESRGESHHFFGRADEIELLRGYVGAIGPDTTRQRARRMIDWASRAVRGRAPMVVWGVGGVGKTTLIAKFMLEHAEAAASRFPFAYLDFDRTTLSPRQPSGLLAEMCMQVAGQFPELAQPAAELRARVLNLAGSLSASQEPESISLLSPLLREFRKLLDDHLESLDSLGWQRPFLLVFDTFEVVQYREEGIAELEAFVKGFSPQGESGMWPRLRLIISGRKEVKEFISEVEGRGTPLSPLGPLDPNGSAELLMALTREVGKPITRRDAESLVAALAKASGERGGGVQPLRLHLVGEAFCDPLTEEDGPAIARSLLEELSQPLQEQGRAAKLFIDGVLIRRVLGHVSDARVRALADPGLVVRYITPDVIMYVMTRATPEPVNAAPSRESAPAEEHDDDTPPTRPWVVDRQQAERIFEAFGKEVTLVESEGNALRHRADVRQQMLPLIRARSPRRFELLSRLAFDYFRGCAERDGKDLTSTAEAVYHGLWLGEPLEVMDRLWPKQQGFDARIDPEEFEPGSPANVFVRAKTFAALSMEEVSALPREVALEWLDARSRSFLQDRRVEPALETIRAATGQGYEALDDRPQTAATLARLLYRAGFWHEAAALTRRHLARGPGWLDASIEPGERTPKGLYHLDEVSLSLARTFATVVGKSAGAPETPAEIYNLCKYIQDPLARVEIGAYAAVALARGRDSFKDHSTFPRLYLDLLQPFIVRSARGVRQGAWRREQRVLRLAIITTGDSEIMGDLLAAWVNACERVPRGLSPKLLRRLMSQIFFHSSARREVDSILEEYYDAGERASVLDRLDELWRGEKQAVLGSPLWREENRNGLRTLVAFDHSDWTRPLGNALTRVLKQQEDDSFLRRLESESALIGVVEKRRIFSRKTSQRRQQDGVAVVQLAADEGRLLDLAAWLIDWQEKSGPQSYAPYPSEASRESGGHPQDAFDISRALLRWHQIVTEHFLPGDSPGEEYSDKNDLR